MTKNSASRTRLSALTLKVIVSSDITRMAGIGATVQDNADVRRTCQIDRLGAQGRGHYVTGVQSSNNIHIMWYQTSSRQVPRVNSVRSQQQCCLATFCLCPNSRPIWREI